MLCATIVAHADNIHFAFASSAALGQKQAPAYNAALDTFMPISTPEYKAHLATRYNTEVISA
jgi:hypothetical protein